MKMTTGQNQKNSPLGRAKRQLAVGLKAAIITGIAVVMAAVITGTVSLLHTQAPARNAQSVNVSQNQAPIVQAAPNATVNVGISEATMLSLLRDKAVAANVELSQKFPHGYALLGAVNGKIVYEPNFNSIKFDADWEHTTVQIDRSNQTATFLLPYLNINTGSMPLEMRNVAFKLSYIDNKLTPIAIGPTAIWAEVLDVDKGIYVIGFK